MSTYFSEMYTEFTLLSPRSTHNNISHGGNSSGFNHKRGKLHGTISPFLRLLGQFMVNKVYDLDESGSFEKNGFKLKIAQ